MDVWHVLRRGAPTALVIGLAPMQLVAQMDTLDLSGQVPETVIPTEFDGGFFARIGQIVVDDKGIWVIDRGHTTVFRFGPEGDLMTEYGREGSGPGEFLFPGDLRIDSVLTVTDPRLGRIVRFSLEGEHLETTRQQRRPVTPDGMEVPLGAVTSLPDGYLIGATVGWYRYGGVRDGEAALGDPFSHILLFHPDGARVDTLASYHMNAGRWDALGLLGGGVDPGLGTAGAWLVLGDSMAVLVDGITGTLTRIRIRNGFPVADTIDLGIRARPVSDRDMANIEARLREEKPGLPRRLEFDLAEGWSVATVLLPGQSGEFWLLQADEGDRQEWVVVKPGSTRKWRVILPEQFVLRAIHDGRLYGVARDEFDVPRVAAFADPRMRR